MHFFIALTAVFLIGSCSSKAPNYNRQNETGVSDGKVDPTKVSPSMEDMTKGEVSPEKEKTDPKSDDPLALTAQGSAMSFLDSRALTQIYQRVFAKGANGWMHCVGRKPTNPADCENIFDTDEQATLGSFALYAPAIGRGVTNLNPVSGLSLNYLRSLRAGLARECGHLVDQEWANMKAGKTEGNRLMKGDVLKQSTLDSFFRTILGIENQAGIAVDIGTAAYAAEFSQSLALMPDPAKALPNAYVNLCIALAMDPLVILY